MPLGKCDSLQGVVNEVIKIGVPVGGVMVMWEVRIPHY